MTQHRYYRVAGRKIHTFNFRTEVELDDRSAAVGRADLDVDGKKSVQSFLSGVDAAAGVAFDAGEFIREAQVCGDAAGLSIGGNDVPFVAVVVGDFGEIVADFRERKLGGNVVFAGRRVQEVRSFLRGEFEEWRSCQEAEYESWQNACSWIVSEFVGNGSGEEEHKDSYCYRYDGHTSSTSGELSSGCEYEDWSSCERSS